MPHFFYKNGVTYIKNHKKQSLFFGLLFIVVLCLLIFNISDVISSIITNSKSIFVQNKLEVPSFNTYAIAISKNNGQDDELIKLIQNMGGAGIYYKEDNCVLISMYPTLLQAKEIEENLKELGNDVKLCTLCVNSISKKYNSKEISKVSNLIRFFKTIYKELFDISINFDRGLKSIKQVKNQIKDTLNVVLNHALNIKTNISDESIKQVLSNYYNLEKENLYNILNFNAKVETINSNNIEENIQFSSLIKQTYFKTIFLNINMVNEINNLN